MNFPHLPDCISFASLMYGTDPRRLSPTATTCFEAFCAFTIARPSTIVAERGFSQ